MHLVQFRKGLYDAPNLKALLTDPSVLKLFHYARFDVAIFQHYLGVAAADLLHEDRVGWDLYDRHGLRISPRPAGY